MFRARRDGYQNDVNQQTKFEFWLEIFGHEVFIRVPTPQKNVTQGRCLTWASRKTVQKLPKPLRHFPFLGTPQVPDNDTLILPKKRYCLGNEGLELILFSTSPGLCIHCQYLCHTHVTMIEKKSGRFNIN